VEGAKIMRRVILNLTPREILSSSQNACLAAGLRPDLLGEHMALPIGESGAMVTLGAMVTPHVSDKPLYLK